MDFVCVLSWGQVDVGVGWGQGPAPSKYAVSSSVTCGVDSSQGSRVSSLAGLFSTVLVHQSLLSGRG